MAGEIGSVVLKDFKLADNLLAGIEIESCLKPASVRV
jgi:hypothetical protein